MDTIYYILALIGAAGCGYWATGKLFNKYIGEVLVYNAKDGKRYKVIKKPGELEKDAIGRLREKIPKTETDQSQKMEN